MYIKGLVNTKDQSNACMCEMMSKESKEALTVLIVTHVERLQLCTQYRYIQCYVKRVKRLCYVETRNKHIFAHNFLNFKQFSIRKKFWKAET